MAAAAESYRQRAEHAAGGIPPLLVAAERIAMTVKPGVHGRRRVGQGETFWQFRQHQPGDSAQAVDWRQSAKTQPLFIRETEWEAAQSIWLWRDTSASMNYRSGRNLPTKRERGDVLLLALAILLLRGGENIALLGTGRPPAHGSGTLDRMALTLARAAAAEDDTPLGNSLPGFELLSRHGHVVLIGDFLSPLEEIDLLLRKFAARGIKGHLVQVLDPAEETLPFTGRSRFEGLEEEGNVLVKRAEKARPEYRRRLEAHLAGLNDITRALSWSITRHRTDRAPETALMSLYAAMSAAMPVGMSAKARV